MTEEAMKAARQDIKHRLSEYRITKQEAAQIEAQLKHLDGAPSGVRLDGMPKGNATGDPVASIVSQRMALEERYKEKLGRRYAAQHHVEELIESLEPTERKLLRHRYIEGLSWEKICVEMSYSWRQCHYIHAQALDRLAKKENKTKGLTNICD